ncbi:hypothetical protein RDI58_020572 [Solanum bulbocastanum]|uniref:Uncharacterized protein n=1 Tax=Solanum bulbocastanum TaxID=147425 RepID=A0AAN8TCD3_SOLBU
MPNALALQV